MQEFSRTVNEEIDKDIHPITGYVTRVRREEKMKEAKQRQLKKLNRIK